MSTYDPSDLRLDGGEPTPDPEEYAEDENVCGDNPDETDEYDESPEELDSEYDDDSEPDDSGTDEDDAPGEGEEGEEEEDENIAAVAERITGMRHSQVSSAAPIRTRTAEPPAAKPTAAPPPRSSIPPRPTEIPKEVPAADPKNPKKKTQHWKYAVLAAALIVVLGGILIAALHRSSELPPDEKELSEIPAVLEQQTLPDPAEAAVETELPSPKVSEEIPEKTDVPPLEEEETSEEDPAVSESDPEPVPETVTEPEPTVEPEPEPEPEFWIQVNFYDRDPIGVLSTGTTLRQLLNERQVWLTDTEVPSVGLDEWLTDNITIQVDKYEWITETVTEEIPFTSEITELDTIPKGTTNYIRTGENGVKETVYNVEYKNGQEFLRSVQREAVTKEPVSEQYEIGVGGTFIGIDGNFYNYNYRRTVPATYYSLEGLTYLGTMADESVIAVDMNYIPLGTQVYVKNDRYDFGVRTAADIGGQLDNWEIDVWLSPSNPYYAAFSREGYIYDMEIYYLD